MTIATQQDRLIQLLRDNPLMRARELRAAGIAGSTIARAARTGAIIRAARGLYQLPYSELELASTLAEVSKRVFDVVLISYGLERLLYRLSISEHHDSFVLKGGMLVTFWTGDENRVTRDVDFLNSSSLLLIVIPACLLQAGESRNPVVDTIHLRKAEMTTKASFWPEPCRQAKP